MSGVHNNPIFLGHDSNINPIYEKTKLDGPDEFSKVQENNGDFEVYCAKYSPDSVKNNDLNKSELVNRLNKGIKQLNEYNNNPKLTKLNFDKLELPKKKEFIADLFLAVDFYQKKQMGNLDLNNDKILGSSSFLMKDPHGLIKEMLMSCDPYPRVSTHFSGYGAAKKGKYGIDYAEGVLPATQKGGKTVRKQHLHFYGFEHKQEHYVGVKFERWGWHGKDIRSFAKVRHSIGHAQAFIATRPPVRKLMNKISNVSSHFMQDNTRTDTNKEHKTIMAKALKAAGIEYKKPSLLTRLRSYLPKGLGGIAKKDAMPKVTLNPPKLGTVAKIKARASALFNTLSNIKFWSHTKAVTQQDTEQSVNQTVDWFIKGLDRTELKLDAFTESDRKQLDFLIQEFQKTDSPEVEERINLYLTQLKEDGLIQSVEEYKKRLKGVKLKFHEFTESDRKQLDLLIRNFETTGRLDDMEALIGYLRILEAAGVIQSGQEELEKCRQLLDQRKEQQKKEGLEGAPTMGNELVFDLSSPFQQKDEPE